MTTEAALLAQPLCSNAACIGAERLIGCQQVGVKPSETRIPWLNLRPLLTTQTRSASPGPIAPLLLQRHALSEDESKPGPWAMCLVRLFLSCNAMRGCDSAQAPSPAHVVVGLPVAIQDAAPPHGRPRVRRAAPIHPGRVAPVLLRYQTVQCLCRGGCSSPTNNTGLRWLIEHSKHVINTCRQLVIVMEKP